MYMCGVLYFCLMLFTSVVVYTYMCMNTRRDGRCVCFWSSSAVNFWDRICQSTGSSLIGKCLAPQMSFGDWPFSGLTVLSLQAYLARPGFECGLNRSEGRCSLSWAQNNFPLYFFMSHTVCPAIVTWIPERKLKHRISLVLGQCQNCFPLRNNTKRLWANLIVFLHDQTICHPHSPVSSICWDYGTDSGKVGEAWPKDPELRSVKKQISQLWWLMSTVEYQTVSLLTISDLYIVRYTSHTPVTAKTCSVPNKATVSPQSLSFPLSIPNLFTECVPI